MGNPKAVGNGVRGDPKVLGGGMRKEGIPKLGGEEETLELWGWEWGIPKLWGEERPQSCGEWGP